MSDRKNLIRELESFTPFNEQEEKDRLFLLDALKIDDMFYRTNKAMHMTSSCWILDETHRNVLLCYHKIYRSWTWLGGHADGEEDLLSVALREAKEESSIHQVKPLLETPFSVEVLTVDGHEKRGEYVSSHLHLNVTYLLEANSHDLLSIKEDENLGVGWFPLDEVCQASTETWFIERVYPKLISKVKKLFF